MNGTEMEQQWMEVHVCVYTFVVFLIMELNVSSLNTPFYVLQHVCMYSIAR